MRYLVTLLLLLSTVGSGDTLKVDASRLVNILGQVDRGILDKANDILALSTASSKPIYLLINSPGGSVMAGNVFIDAMNLIKKKGIKIKCLSTIYNASMAFSIFATCSERYALANTNLLFHPVSIELRGRYGERELTPLAADLANIDSTLQEFLVKSTTIDPELMMEAYYSEKWWTAVELQKVTKEGWLTIIDGLSGIPNPFIVDEFNSPHNGLESLPNFIHRRSK